jgi:hypothetical protein
MYLTKLARIQLVNWNILEEQYSRAREDAALAWIMSVLRMNFMRPLAPVSVSFTHSRPD